MVVACLNDDPTNSPYWYPDRASICSPVVHSFQEYRVYMVVACLNDDPANSPQYPVGAQQKLCIASRNTGKIWLWPVRTTIPRTVLGTRLVHNESERNESEKKKRLTVTKVRRKSGLPAGVELLPQYASSQNVLRTRRYSDADPHFFFNFEVKLTFPLI